MPTEVLLNVMSDKQLMELAAKAAGYEICDYSLLNGMRLYGKGRNQEVAADGRKVFLWSPLYNDGDAFRLALSRPGIDLTLIMTDAWQVSDDLLDRAEYTRRVITTTFAKIGQAMQDKNPA